jgi:hypothetical protein
MCVTEETKAAIEELRKLSQTQGLLDASGKDLPPLPEKPWLEGNWMAKFKKPSGFVVLNRSFLPLKREDYSDPLKLQLQAFRNLPAQSSEESAKNMAKLFPEMKTHFGNAIESFLERVLTESFQKEGVTYRGKVVKNTAEALKAWKTETISLKKVESYFKILYGMFDQQEYMQMLEYQLYMELGIWFTSNPDDEKDYTFTKKKIRATFLRHMMRDKWRDNFRGRYQRKSEVPHGVMLTVSKKGGNQGPRRKKGGFVLQNNAPGYSEEKVKAFNLRVEAGEFASKKKTVYKVPAIQEEEAPPSPEEAVINMNLEGTPPDLSDFELTPKLAGRDDIETGTEQGQYRRVRFPA